MLLLRIRSSGTDIQGFRMSFPAPHSSATVCKVGVSCEQCGAAQMYKHLLSTQPSVRTMFYRFSLYRGLGKLNIYIVH